MNALLVFLTISLSPPVIMWTSLFLSGFEDKSTVQVNTGQLINCNFHLHTLSLFPSVTLYYISLSLRTHVCMSMYVYMHTCIHVYMFACARVCIYPCMCPCVYVCVCMCLFCTTMCDHLHRLNIQLTEPNR